MNNYLLTLETIAKEYARLYQPSDNFELNEKFKEGMLIFGSNFELYSDSDKALSLNDFSIKFIVPILVRRLKNQI